MQKPGILAPKRVMDQLRGEIEHAKQFEFPNANAAWDYVKLLPANLRQHVDVQAVAVK